MKNLIFFLTFILQVMVAAAGEPSKGASLSFEKPSYEFGEIDRKGGDVRHKFVYTNKGDAPLVLTRVISSCSCMKVKYERKPVMPGKSGELVVIYQARKGDVGVFNKVIHIFSNSTDGKHIVTVRGIIVKK